MDKARAATEGGSTIALGVVAILIAALVMASSHHHLVMASGASGGPPVRHAAMHAIPGNPCPPDTPGSKLVRHWESTRTGPIFLKCSGWRHMLRGHYPRGATAREILDCISKVIEYGSVSSYPEGIAGHLPGHDYTWNWDEDDPRVWVKVIVSFGDPGYIVTGYPNAKRALGDKRGDWRGCAAG